MVEKARHFLQEKQLIQTDCRYVFNRTHWLINKYSVVTAFGGTKARGTKIGIMHG